MTSDDEASPQATTGCQHARTTGWHIDIGGSPASPDPASTRRLSGAHPPTQGVAAVRAGVSRPVATLARAAVTALAVATVGLAPGALAPAEPAAAATILLITPSSVEPGFPLTLSATCDDNLQSATVTSDAFGTVSLLPQGGKLRTTVTVPRNTAPGTYSATLVCSTGAVANNTFDVTRRVTPETVTPTVTFEPNRRIGPATGGGEMAASTTARLAPLGGVAAAAAGVVTWIAAAGRPRTGIRR